MEDVQSDVARCLEMTIVLNMAVRCSISTEAADTRCGLWNIAEMRDCVNTGMRILGLSILKGRDRFTVARTQANITAIRISLQLK